MDHPLDAEKRLAIPADDRPELLQECFPVHEPIFLKQPSLCSRVRMMIVMDVMPVRMSVMRFDIQPAVDVRKPRIGIV